MARAGKCSHDGRRCLKPTHARGTGPRAMRKFSSLVVSFVAVFAFAGSPDRDAAKLITAQQLRAHVGFLASDLLEGRGPATQGDLLAQQYIAAQFEALGLKPAGSDGGWFQKVDLVGINGHPQGLTFAGTGGK